MGENERSLDSAATEAYKRSQTRPFGDSDSKTRRRSNKETREVKPDAGVGEQEDKRDSVQKAGQDLEIREGEAGETAEVRSQLHEVQGLAEVVADQAERVANVQEDRQVEQEEGGGRR